MISENTDAIVDSYTSILSQLLDSSPLAVVYYPFDLCLLPNFHGRGLKGINLRVRCPLVRVSQRIFSPRVLAFQNHRRGVRCRSVTTHSKRILKMDLPGDLCRNDR